MITTPFTFPATANAIKFAGLKPIFVDICKETFNINPQEIERNITSRTSAILPVHSFGFACDTEKIQKIADKHNLKVVYDAAHAFGTDCHCGKLFSQGDISITSFHATKVIQTFEGGATFTNNISIQEKLEIQSFGLDKQQNIEEDGINAKMNEVQAAMGNLQLDNLDLILRLRRERFELYITELEGIDGLQLPKHIDVPTSNCSYFPILILDEFPLTLTNLIDNLKAVGINPRRYFYPILTDLTYFKPKKEKSFKYPKREVRCRKNNMSSNFSRLGHP